MILGLWGISLTVTDNPLVVEDDYRDGSSESSLGERESSYCKTVKDALYNQVDTIDPGRLHYTRILQSSYETTNLKDIFRTEGNNEDKNETSASREATPEYSITMQI